MMQYLNFNNNDNGKLWLRYFTTIRSLATIEEKHLHQGDIVEIQKDHVLMFRAQIVSIEEIDLVNLSQAHKTLLMLDCGCCWEYAVRYIIGLCGTSKVVVITLSK